jgi:hypothetical protein
LRLINKKESRVARYLCADILIFKDVIAFEHLLDLSGDRANYILLDEQSGTDPDSRLCRGYAGEAANSRYSDGGRASVSRNADRHDRLLPPRGYSHTLSTAKALIV